MVAAVLSLITVIALTPLFKDLPEAVLAALIIHAVSHLMKVAEMRRYYRLVRREFWLGMLTLAGVIVLDVLPGLIIGVVLSILLVVYRDSRVPLSVLGADPAVPGAYLDRHRHPTAQPTPGVLAVRPDGTVYYVNAQSIQDTLEALIASSTDPVRRVRHRPGRQRRAGHHQQRNAGEARRRPTPQPHRDRLRPLPRPCPRHGPPRRRTRRAKRRPNIRDHGPGSRLGHILRKRRHVEPSGP